MKDKAAVKAIEATFNRLARVLDGDSRWPKFLDLVKAEEKDHRRSSPAGPDDLSLPQSVRLFAVKAIFRRYVRNGAGSIYTPTAEEFFDVRKSLYGAAAVVAYKGEAIRQEFTRLEMFNFLDRYN